ncbi:MAG: hypothetical protein ACF8NJ_08720, partial [Phycisphaerales bacterium JB038]
MHATVSRRSGRWAAAAIASMAALVATAAPSWSAEDPTPPPATPAAAVPEPSPEPSPTPDAERTGAPSEEPSPQPSTEPSFAPSAGPTPPADSQQPESATRVSEALESVTRDEAPDPVQSRPVETADPAETDADDNVYGAEQSVVPQLSDARTEVVEDLDAAIRDRDPAAHDSILVGVGEHQSRDLAEALYGEQGRDGLVYGRPDLAQAGLPSADAGEFVDVEVIPQLSGGSVPGAAFTAQISGASLLGPEWVEIAFDVSGFEHAYGGNYGDRLQLMAMPECALNADASPACLVAIPLETRRDANGVMRAFVPAESMSLSQVAGRFSAPTVVALGGAASVSHLPTINGVPMDVSDGRTIIAAVAGADSQAGSFSATDLAPSGTWGVSEPQGAFTYSIPIALPPAATGPVPNVSLSYSSQAVDGKTSATNSQASVVGDGWSMPVNYIERLFKPCKDQGGTTAQLCWESPYGDAIGEAAYVLSLNGQTEELILTSVGADSSTYVAASDPTLVVTRYEDSLGRPQNDDDDDDSDANGSGEYFTVETRDGSTYYFGFAPTTAEGAPTNSIAWQPVYSNNPGEPGNTGSQVEIEQQAYRFMLDLSVDAHDNAITYFYERDENA